MPSHFRLYAKHATLACLLALNGLAAGAQELVQHRLLQQFELPLRWDNVSTDPLYWIRGEKPVWRSQHELYGVRLTPGRSVTVRIPADATLRLHALEKKELAGLSVERSNGNGLYVSHIPRRSKDGRDWLIACDQQAPQLIRISLPANSTVNGAGIDIGLFVSRVEPLGRIAPYRHIVPLSGKEVRVARLDKGGDERFWTVVPNVPVAMEVEGPTLYALQNHLHFPASEATLTQDWRIEAHLDDKPHTRLEFTASVTSEAPFAVNGQPAALSRMQEGYLEIPPGRHRLVLVSNEPLLARLAIQKEPDYLFPRLNEPILTARAVREQIRAEKPDPISGGQEANRNLAAAGRSTPPDRIISAAARLHRDNRVRDANAQVLAASEQMVARHPENPELKAAVSGFDAQAVYRPLLPRDKDGAEDVQYAWHLLPHLRDVGTAGSGVSVSSQHAGALIDNLSSSQFFPLEADGLVQHYDLTVRHAPGWLRVQVHAEATAGSETIFLQYDNEKPMTLSLAPLPEVSGADMAPTTSEAALRMQQEQHGEYGIGTLSAAFSRQQAPAPLVAVRYLDIPLPGKVQRLRLWRSRSSMPLRVTLKYRAAKPFRLSEQAYLAVTARQNNFTAAEGLIPSFRTALSINTAARNPDKSELDSHWQSLARLVRDQAALFGAGVSQLAIPPVSRVRDASASQRAAEFAAAKQWLPALETWSAVLHGNASTEERQTARWGQISALRQLGEEFLANQMLKQEMLFGHDAATRIRARETLAAYFRNAGDAEGLVGVYSAALLRDGDTDRKAILTGLCAALLDNGESALALDAGLLLPPAERPHELLLRAAYAEQWWATFDQLLATMPDAERRYYWLAQKALGEGRFDEAIRNLRRAGKEGQALIAHIEKAQNIHRQRTLPPTAENLAAWGNWLKTHPGQRAWREADYLVNDFAGSHALYVIGRDLYQYRYRSDANKPVRLQIIGPVKMRVEARPLHVAGGPTHLEGWLRVRSGKGLWVAPVTQNTVNDNIALVGDSRLRVGRKIVREIELGTGWHSLEVDGGKLPLLLGFSIEQPEQLLPLLPLLTPATAQLPDQGVDAGLTLPGLWSCPNCSWLMDDKGEAGNRTVRLERNLILANKGRFPSLVPITADGKANPAADAADDASLLASGKWQSLLQKPADNADYALRERMLGLLWIAENQPEHRAAALAVASSIHADHPETGGLASPLARLGRDSAWTPIEIVNSSAGLRSREIGRWEPEAPAMRARRALMSPTGSNTRMLGGEDRLVMSMLNPRGSQIRLTLGIAEAAGMPLLPMTAMLQVDRQSPQRVDLGPTRPSQQRMLTVPAGQHSVRIWIDKPVMDQFLQISADEAGRPQFAESVERFYHVATPSSPVRIALHGPAWLRIDEWRNGATETRYRWIDKGVQQINLAPPQGRSEALYRLHLRSLGLERAITPPRIFNPPVNPVAEPDRDIPERKLTHPVPLSDGLILGRQEMGTWSFAAGYRQRLYSRDEDWHFPGGRNDYRRENFLELSAGKRYFDPDSRTYYRGEVLARKRQSGDPTLGLAGSASTNPAWTSWHFDADARLFAQHVKRHSGDASEGSWGLRAGAWQQRDISPTLWHVPRIGLFARGTTLKVADAGTQAGVIDQDVFTPYRAVHRRGIEMGDALVGRPWLDSEWRLAANLVGNEDYRLNKPDHLEASLEWKQMFGSYWLKAGWTHYRYFSDSDRDQPSTHRLASIDWGTELWQPNQERLEIGLSFQRDIEARANLVNLRLLWHFGNGRGYRDFSNAELPFADLRQRRVPNQPNNLMEDER